MKKINLVGGGPAGALFAILMRRAFPKLELQIFERNAPDQVEGWGIVLNTATIGLLEKCDAKVHERIAGLVQRWSDVDTYHKNQYISVRGKPFVSVSRKDLTSILRRRCEEAGIPIHYETGVDDPESARDCDLLVGADGAYSAVRSHYADHFEPEVDIRPDYFIWLGTNRVFPTITHIFKNTAEGVISAEGYLYSPDRSTFIAICNPESWRRCGFESMSREQTVEHLARVFEAELEGHDLMMNEASRWRNFPLVTNRNWFHPNVLLLGDALHTAHFSIGSGTRLAIEDAIMASESLQRYPVLDEALKDFEKRRKPFIERYQSAARDSLTWYENVDRIIDLDIIPFAYETMTRSDKLGIRSLKLQDPDFVERYRQWQIEQGKS